MVSTEVEEASEADGAAHEAAEDSIVVEDVSAIAAMEHRMARLQALEQADSVAATEVVDSTIVARATTLTWNPCLLEAIAVGIAVEIAVATEDPTGIRTEIATALVGMPDRSDLTTAVGMTSQGRDAATKWPYHWAPDRHHSSTKKRPHPTSSYRGSTSSSPRLREPNTRQTNGESDYLLRVSTGSHRQLRVHHY